MQKNLGKIKRTVEEYVVLTVATLILVVGVYVFKFPNNFSFGGVTGLAVVLGAVLPTSPGNLTFIINMLLLVLGFIFLGRGFGVKTVYVSVLTSVGLSFAERVFPMDAPLTGQPVLELIYAIVLPAFSVLGKAFAASPDPDTPVFSGADPGARRDLSLRTRNLCWNLRDHALHLCDHD